MILILLISICASAQIYTEGKPIFKIPSRAPTQERAPSLEAERTPTSAPKRKKITLPVSMPSHDRELITQSRTLDSATSPFIAFKVGSEKLSSLLRSSILKARISDSIIAYEGSKEPVRAVVTEGDHKGTVLFGNASMDKITKHAIVVFDTLILPDQNQTYRFVGTIKDQDGNSGLSGEVKTDFWKYFGTQAVLDTASAAADATTQRTANVSGTYNVVPGPDSTIRQGIAGGAAKTADRLSDRNQTIREYVQVIGPQYVRVMVLEQPERNQNGN